MVLPQQHPRRTSVGSSRSGNPGIPPHTYIHAYVAVRQCNATCMVEEGSRSSEEVKTPSNTNTEVVGLVERLDR